LLRGRRGGASGDHEAPPPATKLDEERRRERHMNPNSRYYMGWTDLHSAASAGDAECVRELLEEGADPNAKNEYGWTPLHVAAREGHVDVARLLLQHGADPSIRSRDGKTPLDLAKERGHREVASLMEGWLGQWAELTLPGVYTHDGRKARIIIKTPGVAPVRSAPDAICEVCCETCCEAWRIINQIYHFVREGRVMTAKEFEDLEKLFYIFKGHVEALETMTTRPDVKELINIRDYIELLLPHLRRGDLPADALSKITSLRHRINNLKQQLACSC
jgi:hypothetical protein